MSDTLEGIWLSRYEYGRGSNDEPHFSEHKIHFTQKGDAWVGKSLPNEEGSAVTLVLSRNDKEFSGQWTERTSPTGHYHGKEFSGLILLLLQNENTELNGICIGAGSSSERVKASKWNLKRA